MKTPITILLAFVSTLSFGQSNIFSPDKKFLYSVEYSLDSVTVLDIIKITSTGRPWKTDPDKQLEIIITYELERLDTSVFSKQSSIGWVNSDTTGAVDNKNSCWFHPPRHNQYKMLEIAPFPRVEYPLWVDKTYSRLLFIGDGWGEISNSKVVWHYNVIGRVGDNWKISARAIPENKPENINRLEFTFRKKEGFIDLEYIFYDGTKVRMKKL